LGHSDVKNRKTANGNGDVKGSEKSAVHFDDEEVEGGPVKHYDADVLTKVVVYTGIGILATVAIPIMFEVLGWGAKAS